jgi:hypothetical protein
MTNAASPDPYESVYLGQLVYAVGYTAREVGIKPNENCCQLFASSPADQTFGDLVLGWQGRFFMLEAKRNESSVCTEWRKPHRRRWLRELAREPALLAIAQHMHFVAYGRRERNAADGQRERNAADIVMMQYHLIVDAPVQTERRFTLGAFLRERVRKFGCSGDEFKRYVGALHATCGAASSPAEPRRTEPLSTGSLVMNYDPSTKELAFVVIDLLRDLARTIEPPHRGLEMWSPSRSGPSR